MRPWSFLRADDLEWDGPFLVNLVPLLEQIELPCMLGVIPLAMADDVPAAIERLAARARGPLWVAQHGSDHHNRAPAGKKDELGDAATDAAHLARLAAGRHRLLACCGARFIDVYIPPWNTRTPHTESLIAAAGLRAISGWRGRGGNTVLDVCLDMQESYRPARLLPAAALTAALSAHPGGGIMLHPALWSATDAVQVAAALVAARGRRILRPPTEAEMQQAMPWRAGPARSFDT